MELRSIQRNRFDSIASNQNVAQKRLPLSVSFSKVGRGYCDKGQVVGKQRKGERGILFNVEESTTNFGLNVERCKINPRGYVTCLRPISLTHWYAYNFESLSDTIVFSN